MAMAMWSNSYSGDGWVADLDWRPGSPAMARGAVSSDEYSVASSWRDEYSVDSSWRDEYSVDGGHENDPCMVAVGGRENHGRHENDGGHENRGGHEDDPLSRADPWSQLGQGRSSDQAISDMKRDESKWWQEVGHPKNIIKMYEELCDDREILEDAFKVFAQEQKPLEWHWTWHEHADLNRCGCGQYYAMVVMKSAMPNSVREHGISNQDTVHKYMEGFMAWVMKGQNRLQWQWQWAYCSSAPWLQMTTSSTLLKFAARHCT